MKTNADLLSGLDLEIDMFLIGHGIDIVDVSEFERLLNTPQSSLAARCFTSHEISWSNSAANRIERLAARFAAKEAVLKSLGTGWVTGISLKHIEVQSADNGAPSIVVKEQVERLANQKGVSSFLVSLSHTRTHAMASVIAVGDAANS